MKYSLWFVPDKGSGLYDKLSSVINSLSQEFNAPKFVPHITLLSDIKATEEQIKPLTATIADYSKPFKVELGCLDYTDHLFQSLVIRIVHSEYLREIDKEARNIFERHSDALFVPHISLLYKYGISVKKKKELVFRFERMLKGESWLVGSIHIYTSVSSVEKWRFIDQMRFSQN